jgi:fibronectin-binding autotransporter adhesin
MFHRTANLLTVFAIVLSAASAASFAATLQWDPNVTGNTNPGGSGFWDSTSNGWWNGAANVAWSNGSDAFFGGATGGNVTLMQPMVAGKLTFNQSGYTLGGSAITLTVGNVAVHQYATIASALSGTAGLVKSDSGTLLLSAANTFTGNTTVGSGMLQIGQGGTTGSLNASSAVSIASGASLFYYSPGQTIANNISGQGTWAFSGPGSSNYGNYSIAGTNSGFVGRLLINNGARYTAVTAANLPGPGASITVNNGGTFFVGGAYNVALPISIAGIGWAETSGNLGALRMDGNPSWSGPIALLADARIGMFATNSGIISGTISGPYQLELWKGNATGGAGTMVLSGNNTFGSLLASGSMVVIPTNAHALGNGPISTADFGVIELNGINITVPGVNGGGGQIVNGASTAATITVGADGSSSNYGGIVNDGGLAPLGVVKSGSGAFKASGNNNYTGGTMVYGGVLQAGSSQPCGPSGASVTIAAGATFDFFSQALAGVNYAILVSGSGAGGNGALVNSGTEQINAIRTIALAGDALFGGPSRWDLRSNVSGGAFLSGNGFNLTKTGASQISLVGAGGKTATISGIGNININQGSLTLELNATVDNAVPGSIYVNTSGTLGVGNWGGSPGVSVLKPIVLNGGSLCTTSTGGLGNAVIAAAVRLNATGVVSPQSGSALVLSGAISDGSGPNGLLKADAGTLVLTAANTFSGNTTIGGGTLQLAGGDNRLPKTTAFAFSGNGLLDIDASNQALANVAVGSSVTGSVRGTGTLTVNGTQNLAIGNTVAGTATLNLAGLSSFAFNSPSATFGVGGMSGGTDSCAGILTLAGSSRITASALNVQTIGPTGAGTALDSGTLNLGQRTVLNVDGIRVATSGRDNGTIQFGSLVTNPSVVIRAADGVGRTNMMIGQRNTVYGATSHTAKVDLINNVSGIAVLDASVGTLTLGQYDRGYLAAENAIFQMNGGTLDATMIGLGVMANNNGNYGVLNSTFSLKGGLVKAGMLTVGTHNDANGTLNSVFALTGSTLQAQNIQSGAGAANRTIAWSDGTIANYDAATDLTIGSGIAIKLGSNGTHSLAIDAGRTATVNSAISETGTGYSLTKTGAGSLILNAVNTYTGATLVNQGKLAVNGSLASDATVNSGGTLSGAGHLLDVTINAGGHLAPGNSPGMMILTGNLILNPGARMDYDLGAVGTSDVISMPGGLLALNGMEFDDLDFTTLDGFGTGTYTLINAAAVSGGLGAATGGTINGLPAELAIQGNDLVLNVVPEPSAGALLLAAVIGMSAAVGYQRRITFSRNGTSS